MSNPITDSRGDPIDVTQLETSGLRELVNSHRKSANELLEDHRKANPDNKYAPWQEDAQEKYVAHNAALDVLLDEVKRRDEIDRSEERLALAEKAGRGMLHPAAGSSGVTRPFTPADIASKFTDLPEYKAARESGSFDSDHNIHQFGATIKGPGWLAAMGRKSLVYTNSAVGGSFVIPEYLPGYVPTAQQQPDILSFIPRGRTGSDTIHWNKQTGWTQAATTVSEASNTTGTSGTKPEGALGFLRQTTPVSTIAVWMPVTNQMLADAPQVESVITQHLLKDLQLELDNQVLNGGGTAPDFTGILNAGIGAIAYGTAYNNVMDAVLAGITLVQTGDYRDPDAIIMHPNDFEDIRKERENAATATLGAYLMGPPSQSGPVTLWGRPISTTVRITEGTTLIGAFDSGCMLFDREQSTIKVGLINDYFVRNMQVILAEMRAGFVVFRPASFCQVTGI